MKIISYYPAVLLFSILNCYQSGAQKNKKDMFPLATLKGTAGYSRFVISSQGKWIAGTNSSGNIQIWKKGSQSASYTFKTGHSKGIISLGVSPDELLLATIGADNSIKIFDIGTGQCNTTIPVSNVQYAALSPDNQYAAIRYKSDLYIYDLNNSKNNTRNYLNNHIKVDSSCSVPFVFFPDGTRISVISPDKSVRHYNITDSTDWKMIEKQNRWVQELNFIGPDLLKISFYTAYKDGSHTKPALLFYDVKKAQVADTNTIIKKRYFSAPRISQQKGDQLLTPAGNEKFLLVKSAAGKIESWESNAYSASLENITSVNTTELTKTWTAFEPFRPGYNSLISNIDMDKEGNSFMLSSYIKSNGKSTMAITRFDTDGIKSWSNIFSTTSDIGEIHDDKPADLAADRAGNVYITGSSSVNVSSGPYYPVLVKYDRNGKKVWQNLITADINSFDAQVVQIKTGKSGHVYVTANATALNKGVKACILVMKYAADGTLLWSKKYSRPAADLTGPVMVIDNNDNVFIMCRSKKDQMFAFPYCKYNTNGELLWDFTYSICNGYPAELMFYNLAVNKQDELIVAATVKKRYGTNDIYTIKTTSLDTAGKNIHENYYEAPNNTMTSVNNLYIDGSDNIYISLKNTNRERDVYDVLLKYNKNIEQVFVREIKLKISQIMTTANEDILLSGIISPQTYGGIDESKSKYFLCRYNKDGEKILWSATYPEEGYAGAIFQKNTLIMGKNNAILFAYQVGGNRYILQFH